MQGFFEAFWDGFTNVPVTIYNSFSDVIDFVKDLPSIFIKVCNFVPYPLNIITITFIPIIVLIMTFKVIKE